MILPWRYFRRLVFTAVFLLAFVALTVFILRVLNKGERKGKLSSLPSEDYSAHLTARNASNSKQLDAGEDKKLDRSFGTSIPPVTKLDILTKRPSRRTSLELTYNEEVEETSCASRVHIFYYPWYGNPTFDSKYIHWNHEYLPHWDRNIAKRYKKGRHSPPKDIGANFYPKLGCYSSRDPEVMEAHMAQIKSSGAGVVVVSWYPPDTHDGQGIPVDSLIPQLLNVADNYNLKVTLHIEPYKGRNADSVLRDIMYIKEKYFIHPGFYKFNREGKELPLLYIYDSYHTKPEEWAELLSEHGPQSIRKTKYDAIMIGLLVESRHKQDLLHAGFDGFYTYFASHGFTYGSTLDNWDHLSTIAKQNGMMFIPSVGPGYVDTQVRPWNDQNTKDREEGNYYIRSLKFALESKPDFISITSFNEWHEGTQIEPAVPKRIPGFIYQDYMPDKPEFYLLLTKRYTEKFQCPPDEQ